MPLRILFIAGFLFIHTITAMAAGLPVRYLGIEQGLSNNAITTIYQDHNGFMWIGTYDGLNRFDGYNFTIFRNVIGDTNSLATNNVYCIEGDAGHNIWVGTQNGVSIYNPATGHFRTPAYRLVNDGIQRVQEEVSTIKCIHGGDVLIGSQRNGLIVFDKGAGTGRQIPLVTQRGNTAAYRVHVIEYDEAHQRTWVFIDEHGLYTYDAVRKVLTPVTDQVKHANSMKVDGQGNVWIGTDNDLLFFDITKRAFTPHYLPAKNMVVSLCFDKNGTLWIGSDGAGVYQLLPGTTTAIPFQPADAAPQINSNAVYAVYIDRDDRKWIGTLRGGLNIIEPRPLLFRHVVYQAAGHNNMVDNFILSFCEDQQHNIYIGTDGAGLRYWDVAADTYTQYKHDPANPASISSNFITSLSKDTQQDIWISTWFGAVNRLKYHSHQFEHFTLYNPNTRTDEANAWIVYEDARKNIWASTTNDGSIYRFNRQQNRFELFDAAVTNLQCIAEDRQGHLWGGNYTSLIQIDRDHRHHQVYPIGQPVRCIHESRAGALWLGTQGGGLLLFDRTTGSFRRFTTTDGLPSNTILRLLEDAGGNIWMSTYNGICRFNPHTHACDNFSQSDGLQSNQFSFNAALALTSGEFLFGGIKGFNLFHPDSIATTRRSAAIFLTGLKVNNKPVEEQDGYVTERNVETIQRITVPFHQAVLSLDFVALDYAGADKIKYAYFLQGWDKGWNYLNNSRTANYARLQEGDYFFKVKTSQPGGGWGEGTILLQITILPPWYRTWWAYVSYLLLVLGGIYAYIRYTRRQERLKYEIKLAHLENEKEKELAEKKLSFFTSISHEFRTPLSLIINPIKEKLQHTPDLELTVAYRNARRLLSLVDQLLLFRKADSGADILKITRLNIVLLCNEVFQCFVQQAHARNMQYRFVAAEDEILLYADYEKIEIALFNLLSNAFKFTPDGGAITCSLSQTADAVAISISDTGCGIDEADSKGIFEKFQQATKGRKQKAGFGIGLYLVRHFITSHGGHISVSSRQSAGAAFIITLYKGTVHLPDNCVIGEEGNAHELLAELTEEMTPLTAEVPAVPQEGKTAEEVITDKKTILIVDDNAEVREYLQHIFTARYHLFTAENGLEGLEMASRHLPDLVISDINMDGIDGLELCRKIKQSDELGHIPVILLTAASSPDSRIKGVEGGADDYITKPFDSQLLLARVETTLKNRNLLQRYFLDSITLQESSVKVPKEYREFLRRCIQVVEDNLDTEDFTIQKFCRLMGLSRSTLYLKIKHISGQSLNAFIRSVRLRRAAVLMIKEHVNVNQAAFQTGIGDVRYFREQFVKLFGMTPSEYIKRYRQPFNGDLNLIHTESTD